MEITREIFWRDAARGGIIIGLVAVGFELLEYAIGLAEVSFWGGFTGFISFLVFGMLVYAFTKKISSKAEPVMGFGYGRCMSFVVCMMLFTGFVTGIYSSIMNNFVSPDTAMETVDSMMAILQDMIPADQFDAQYRLMRKMMFNPFLLVFSGIFGHVIYGALVGLVTSAFARKNPDIFAEDKNI